MAQTTQDKILNLLIDELEEAHAFLKRRLKTTQDDLDLVAERLNVLRTVKKANLQNQGANVKKELN